MTDKQQIAAARQKAVEGGRLSIDDALALYEDNDLLFLADCARRAKERASGRSVYYTVNRHINLTNICSSNCPLCAFQVEEGDARGYVLETDDIARILDDAKKVKNLSEIHIVSALHPSKPFSYYVDVVKQVKAALPDADCKAFTPVEVVNFSKMTGKSVREVLEILKDAGLDSLPGGGAEILSDRVRQIICPKKATAAEWETTMRTAHSLGIRTNASMMYGHIETVRERFEHLATLRAIQDDTRGFQAFMLFPFHPAHTKLGEEYHLTRVGAWEDLKMMALSRLFLDNIAHVKAFWIMMTLPIAELALQFGADDLDGTIGEEKIIHAAGAKTQTGITKAKLQSIIREAGYDPVERDTFYRPIHQPSSLRETSLIHQPPSQRRKTSSGCFAGPLAAGGVPCTANQPAQRDFRGCDQNRMTEKEAVELLQHGDVLALGRAADAIRRERYGDTATFLIDRNINYTNVCQNECRFCAFYCKQDDPRAYLLSTDEILAKCRETAEAGGTQVMIQGGLYPGLGLDYYLDMLQAIKREFPQLVIHSFTATEIQHFAKEAGLSIRETLLRLQDAGLASLPGGGAEILDDAVRSRVSPKKISTDDYLDVMRTAHEIGMESTATMVIGLGETMEQRIASMARIRRLQDETGGFRAFIMWTFQPGHTALERDGEAGEKVSAIDYMKTLALSRLFFDNIAHIQGSWVTQGERIGQLTLGFGADDAGSIMLEENVVRAAGTRYDMTENKMVRLIRAAGFTPAQRDTEYHVIRNF